MDTKDRPAAEGGRTEPYDHLSDADLRTAIRFTESHLRTAVADHDALCRAYRREIATMRRLLTDRGPYRITTCGASPLSGRQRALDSRFRALGISAERIRLLVRAASRERTDQVGALTDVEAIAMLLCLVSQR